MSVAKSKLIPVDYSTPGSARSLFGLGVGRDPYPQYPQVDNPDTSQWDKRSDGSDKGMGWLGLRQRPDGGGVSSEISVDVGQGDIPAMVPGLTQEQMHFLMTTPVGQMNGHWPEGLLGRAAQFAAQRRAQGLSPFRGPNEPTQYIAPSPNGVLPINYHLPLNLNVR